MSKSGKITLKKKKILTSDSVAGASGCVCSEAWGCCCESTQSQRPSTCIRDVMALCPGGRMTAEAAEDISQVQCLMMATAGWEVVSGHFYSQQRPDQVFNSYLFRRNTSGTFSVWCSNQPRPPYTSTKWDWRFRNTPFVSSRHSSRKESLTTAAMGPGRAGGDRTEEPPLQCLLVEAGLRVRGSLPCRVGPASRLLSSHTQCLSVGLACFACG